MAVATTTTTAVAAGSMAIGPSVIQLLDDAQFTTINTEAVEAQHTASTPSLLIPNRMDSPKRILLRGPPKSGRTSMAMDLACSVAMNAPCRCRQMNSCRCIAATLFLPMYPEGDEENDRNDDNNCSSTRFPLQCHKVYEEGVPADLESPRGRVQRHHLDAVSPAPRGVSPPPDWDPELLGRIEVRHVSSLRQVLHYLLSVQGKPVHEQPLGAIILDDLDVLASKHASSPPIAMMQTCTFQCSFRPTAILMSMFDRCNTCINSQLSLVSCFGCCIVALLIDASNMLGRLHGSVPPIILATTKTQFAVPWIPTTVTLHQATTEHSWRHLGRGTTVASHWQAEITNVYKSPSLASTVDYSFTKSIDDSFHIYWKERSKTNGGRQRQM
jgi:hypothetical protein